MKNILAAGVNIGQNFGSQLGVGSGCGTGVSALVTLFLSASIVIAGVILLFLLVVGGFMVIQGAGNNDPKASSSGKQAITGALIGFILIFSAYFIIRVIEIMIDQPFLTSAFYSGVSICP